MSTNPTKSPYIRVIVQLRFPMESEAFAARLNCEVGFRGAPAAPQGAHSPIGPIHGALATNFDVRLVEHCPTVGRATTPLQPASADHGWHSDLAEQPVAATQPTVLLYRPESVESAAAPCGCCIRVPRQTRWPKLLEALAAACGRKPGRGLPTAEALSCLTRRELDVLRLVGLGMSVAECAKELGVANSTIGNHKYRLMRKLGAANSLQLLRIAVQNGIADFG